MATAAPPRLMTVEEFLALPDDGVDRDLINGVLREWGKAATKRSRKHSRIEARVGKFLDNWLDEQPEPRGEVVSGEAGFQLRHDPDLWVGIDVAYVSPELSAATPEDALYFDGPPTLAVEILSPSDTQERIDEKLDLYREAGVPLVWVINPKLRTVLVLRPDAEPELFNVKDDLTAEPHLAGFRVPVARLFLAR